jgi:hypothetical protein
VPEPARTVGQFRILMDWRNRAGQIVRPGRRNSQGEKKKCEGGQQGEGTGEGGANTGGEGLGGGVPARAGE